MKKLFILLMLFLTLSVNAKVIDITNSIYVDPKDIKTVNVFKADTNEEMYVIQVYLIDGTFYETEPIPSLTAQYEVKKLCKYLRK